MSLTHLHCSPFYVSHEVATPRSLTMHVSCCPRRLSGISIAISTDMLRSLQSLPTGRLLCCSTKSCPSQSPLNHLKIVLVLQDATLIHGGFRDSFHWPLAGILATPYHCECAASQSAGFGHCHSYSSPPRLSTTPWDSAWCSLFVICREMRCSNFLRDAGLGVPPLRISSTGVLRRTRYHTRLPPSDKEEWLSCHCHG